MDTYLSVASKRDERRYDARPVPDAVRLCILDAGRLAGSARNRQPWRFLVVDDAGLKEQLANSVYAPENVRGATFVVAVLGKSSLDVGRAIQNMMLVAWNDGVVSCPNGMPDAEQTAALLGVEQVAIVLGFGYPARPRNPERRSAEEWSARADRKRLDEIVETR